MIRSFLDHCDNGGNPFSDANLIASFVEALGYLRVVGQQALAAVVKQVWGASPWLLPLSLYTRRHPSPLRTPSHR